MELNNYYKVGGSLKANHPTYVYRRADREIIENLKAREYCYVFNSRQMGKSSLRVKAIKKLRKEGIKCASIDLSSIGTRVEKSKWYYSICFQLLSGFDLDDEIDFSTWRSPHKNLTELQQLERLIEDVLFQELTGDLVVFFDEIDTTINLDFKDDFFAFLRGCYNKRSENKNYDRLTVCLLGVATPADLIQDKDRTPFNISRSIELTGFTLEEASSALIPGLAAKFSDPETVLKQILHWTGGQPFLTQKFCRICLEQATNESPNISELAYKYIIDNWEQKDEPEHLRTLSDRLLRNEKKAIKLLELYKNILVTTAKSRISEVVLDNSIEQTELRLSGIAVKRDGYLQVYNPIYQAVFDLNWVKQQLDSLRPYAAAINNWLSSQKDPLFLLDDKELERAILWSKDKSIGSVDREFLTASQQVILERAKLEKEAQVKANQILAKANQKANKIITFGGILAGLLILVSFLGSYLYARQQFKLAEEAITSKELVQQGYNATQQFESRQIEALLTAIEAGTNLQNLLENRQYKDDRDLIPLFALQNILLNIREYNQLESTAETQLTTVSFNPDGKTIAFAGNDGSIELRKNNGTRLTSLEGHTKRITALSFSPDGKNIASVSEDGTVKIWETNGNLIVTFALKQDRLTDIEFSPDGENIATANRTGTIAIWQLDGTLINTFPQKNRRITQINYSPDGGNIAVATDNNTIELWQKDGKLIKTIPAHDRRVISLSFSPDGAKIVSGSEDGNVKVWSKDGKPIATISEAHDGWVTDVSFSPDGNIIASSSNDRTVKLWTQQGTILKTLTGHLDRVTSFSFSPDGNTIASSSLDRTVKLWRVDPSFKKLQNTPVKAIAFSEDDKTVLAVSNRGKISLYKPDGSQIVTFNQNRNFVLASVAFSPNGDIIALGGDRSRIELRNPNGELINSWLGNGSLITSITFSPDGKIIAVGNDRGEIELRNKNGKLITTSSNHKGWITSLTFSQDGNIIASGSDDGTIKVWQKNGKLIATLTDRRQRINSLNFSPDSKILVSASNDGTLKLWNSRGNLITTLNGHNRAVNSVIFSPDGNIIASGSEDGTMKIWQKDGIPITTLNQGDRGITSLKFSPDGNILALATDDGNITFLTFQLDRLLTESCQWLKDYFITHPEKLKTLPVCQRSLQ